MGTLSDKVNQNGILFLIKTIEAQPTIFQATSFWKENQRTFTLCEEIKKGSDLRSTTSQIKADRMMGKEEAQTKLLTLKLHPPFFVFSRL